MITAAVIWVVVCYVVAGWVLLRDSGWKDMASLVVPWAVYAPLTVPITFCIDVISLLRERR